MKKILYVLMFTFLISCGKSTKNILNEIKKEVNYPNAKIVALDFDVEVKFLKGFKNVLEEYKTSEYENLNAQEKEQFDKGFIEFNKLIETFSTMAINKDENINVSKMYGVFDVNNNCTDTCIMNVDVKHPINLSSINSMDINNMFSLVYKTEFVFFYINNNNYLDFMGKAIEDKDKIIKIVDKYSN